MGRDGHKISCGCCLFCPPMAENFLLKRKALSFLRLRSSGRLIYSPVSPGSDFLLSGFAMVSCNVLSCGTQLVGVFFVVVLSGCYIFSDSDLQIQISKNGLHLKLKLHRIHYGGLL